MDISADEIVALQNLIPSLQTITPTEDDSFYLNYETAQLLILLINESKARLEQALPPVQRDRLIQYYQRKVEFYHEIAQKNAAIVQRLAASLDDIYCPDAETKDIIQAHLEQNTHAMHVESYPSL